MKPIFTLATALATMSLASAQSPIFGVDFWGQRAFTTDTENFVANFTELGPNANGLFAMDFDATATTLWALDYYTYEYGTVDLTTGAFSPVGSLSIGSEQITGLTASVDGATWYLSTYDGAVSKLWVGDVTTGSFSLVAPIGPTLIIDIAIDSKGGLYAHSITEDSLYLLDPLTAVGILLGPIGFDTHWAQGMDFDWSTDTLYATLFMATAEGMFATLDVTTGAATVLEVTTPLGAEMGIALRVPAPIQGSPIFGVDLLGDRFYSTGSGNFVGNFLEIGPQDRDLLAMDFDAAAMILWAVDNNTREYGTLGPNSSDFKPIGTLPPIVDSTVTGLTASVDGATWYLSDEDELFVGDITTGTFELVGAYGIPMVVEIAIDVHGTLYGHDILGDALYKIDRDTAEPLLVGPTGFNANFAQGMDFDWSTGVLYATFYGEILAFGSFDLALGTFIPIQDTSSLGELEMAVRQPAPMIGEIYCPNNPNSTGLPGDIRAVGSDSIFANSVSLVACHLPPNQFGYFLASDGNMPVPASLLFSDGLFCLGTATPSYIGRYNWLVRSSGPAGTIQIPVDVQNVPIAGVGGLPPYTIALVAGDTWFFQCWYRDSVMGSGRNNFTSAVGITFQP